MGRGEPWDQRQQAVQTERNVAIDPHQSTRDGSGSNRPFGLVEVCQDAVRSFEKCLTFGGEQQLAGRAIDQPRAQPPLQPRHKLADRRGRHTQCARGQRKAAQFDGPDENLHLSRAIDVRPRHDDFNSQMLILWAVYFITEECAILLPMAAANFRGHARHHATEGGAIMDLHLKDKSALVTGATAGIGLEIARKLAVEGAKVIITGRNKAKLDQAVDSIRTSGGSYVSGVLTDAATEEGAAVLVRATPNADILVNNLGIYEVKDFAAITDADWRRYFEVNVLSGARLARAYFPGMIERNWGRIIFISSESGLVTPAEMIHYGMTKTAQLAISRGLAGLTKGTKVTVNSVLPGPTRSEGIIDFLKSLASDPAAPPEQIEAEFFAKGRPSSLLQRMIEPDEIANLVAYLASPLSSATNGAALRVDGGVTPTIG
jgi:NAD(P)-dependent dehydrogenase (short-subunit alcohol dehydrogenase family)